MIKKAWLALWAAKKEANLLDATRRAAGGSSTRLGLWMAAVAVVALATMSWGTDAQPWGAGICILLSIWGWIDSGTDNLRWNSAHKARESEKAAWLEARIAQSALEANRIDDVAREPGKTSGPQRL